MLRVTLVAPALASLVVVALLFPSALDVGTALLEAQAPPDFSGTWECDLKRSTVCPPSTTLIVNQTADSMWTKGASDKSEQIYKFDSETVLDAVVNGRGEKKPAIRITSKWEGSSLAMYIRTLDTPPEESKTVMRLSADGKEMIVETTSLSNSSEPAIKHTFVRVR